jgi:signal recognition particle subunit SRP54
MFDFLSNKFSSIFSKFGKNTKFTPENVQDVLKSIEDALLEADVPYGLCQSFIESIRAEVLGQDIIKAVKPADQLLKIVHDRLVAFLGGANASKTTFSGVVMVMGLQGSGKTTSIAKLAYIQTKEGRKKVLLASVDFYRPAAIDQLQYMSQKAGANFYRAKSTDPVAAAQEIYAYFKQNSFDVLFLDTAGRLHIDSPMLQELREIDAHLKPSNKLLVLDAMTGQESLTVAQAFDGAVGFDMAMLAKMDSDTRGGAAFSFRYALKKPIVFVGTGEKVDAIEPFHPERMAGRMLDMGDLNTLMEVAEKKIKMDESGDIMKSLAKGQFTLEDFAKQMDMMSSLGSLTQIMKYMPGVGAANIKSEDLERGAQEMKRFRVIMSSMTRKERLNPRILNGQRKARIAKGAGVDVNQVNMLMQRFEQVQQYAKLLKRMGPFKGLFK